MNTKTLFISLALAGTLTLIGGCAVVRGQETVGAYVDDTAITTAVKARFVESKQVAASSISVETLNGAVMLSGFATSQNEKTTAAELARTVNGVRTVQNQIVVRP